MFKFITLGLIAAILYQVPYASEALAAMIVAFLLVYYNLVFRLMVGLNAASINAEDKNSNMESTLSTVSNLTAVAALILQTPYAIVGWLAAPWIAISLLTVIMTWLLYFEIIVIQDNDEE